MRSAALLALLMPSLAGCVTAGGCSGIPLAQHPREQERDLAAELEMAPPGAVWPGIVTSYVELRDAVRACKGEAIPRGG